jgi:hypothetical protein
MKHYAGIDVALERAGLSVIDATGRIVREAKVPFWDMRYLQRSLIGK